MYYNINRILVDEKFQGQKWYSGVICDLIPQSNSVIVFDVTSKVWKFQPLASWNSYLVSIGNLKLAPLQKIDVDDNIVNKTYEELYTENLITKEQYINTKYLIKLENGVVFNGSFKSQGGDDIINPVFQYDEVSQNRLMKYKDISEVNYWRSLNNNNIVLNNTQKNELYVLLITEWASDFDNRLKEINTP